MTEALTVLTAAHVRRWFEHGLRSMLALRRQVDVLNVFPVPDGDTGTNIVLTLAGAARAAGRLPADTELPTLAAAAARGALVGARGNSGVILGQAMHGLARALAGRESLDGAALAAALSAAAHGARRAVDRPVEGTILTVADAAARGASALVDASGAPSAAAVARAALDAATEALAGTRSQLPVLAERDVVDAGAAGYVILLEALAGVAEAAGGPASGQARESLAGLWSQPRPAQHGSACALGPGVVGESGGCAYEVMYVLHATDDDAAHLRRRLAAAGESVAVVGGGDALGGTGLWQVHVHTDDPTAVLAEPGAMEQVGVRPLHVPARGVVACTSVPGLAAPLAGAGAVVALHPDAPGIERGLVDAGAARVLVLAPDGASAELARECLAGGGLLPGGPRGEVLAVDGEVAALAVMAELAAGSPGGVAGPGAPGGTPDLAEDAARAAARVRTAGCAVAELPDVLERLLTPDDELVTAVVGDVPGGPDAVADHLRTAVHGAAPLAEIIVLSGGQAAPELLLGVQ